MTIKKTVALAMLLSAALLGACGSKNKNKNTMPANTGSGTGSAMGGQGYGGQGYTGGTMPAGGGY